MGPNTTLILLCNVMSLFCDTDGFSGVHHKKDNCGSTAVISKVQQVLKSAKKHLYPDYLILTYATILKKNKLRKGNGGWGDHRDHKLCMSMTIS